MEERTGDAMAGVCGFELTADLSDLPSRAGRATLHAVASGAGGERHELPPVPLSLAEEEPDPSLAPPAPLTPRPAGAGGRRVLVCTHQLNLGGAQLYLQDLLAELVRQREIEPTVVSSLDGVLRKDLEAIGIPVHISSLVPLDDLSSHVGRVEELATWAEGREFEVAFVNTATAFTFPWAEAAAQLGIPAVWAIHESFPPPVLWGNVSPAIRRRAEAALAGAELAIFEAEATRRLFEPPLREGHGLVLPYGLDLGPIDATRAGLNRAGKRRELGVDEEAELVLCVGTVEPRKAQLPLAQAFGRIADDHPRAKLVFVGGRDDADTEALEGFIEASELGRQIEVVHVTPDVQDWYAIADLLVCASDIESLPRTVLEAMAYQTPVLATSVFGLPELIEDGVTGWLCEPKDMPALAAALDRALSSSAEERREIGQAARRLVERRHALDAYGREVTRLLVQAADRETAKQATHATSE
jgi:glycosyltransferase involved in cell wall biosynthesis